MVQDPDLIMEADEAHIPLPWRVTAYVYAPRSNTAETVHAISQRVQACCLTYILERNLDIVEAQITVAARTAKDARSYVIEMLSKFDVRAVGFSELVRG